MNVSVEIVCPEKGSPSTVNVIVPAVNVAEGIKSTTGYSVVRAEKYKLKFW